ncbi:predicted protein [Sclerotinia sclerotiorum 1980 UF-70]|uniref:Uncharacterized protein n=1 Tax=Sclerotinia sclerotiorum (strain ATCC 18683 / 1980 / Ss-1) TaxID=665079 RepID=A7ELU1_SCLS1|nr:predicted protein [Sclerotinia sclerotiorum 1980 UF-70]EDO03807.1 predicted protein [Sclerotinia sclerotiorum 1980 UF-70]
MTSRICSWTGQLAQGNYNSKRSMRKSAVETIDIVSTLNFDFSLPGAHSCFVVRRFRCENSDEGAT